MTEGLTLPDNTLPPAPCTSESTAPPTQNAPRSASTGRESPFLQEGHKVNATSFSSCPSSPRGAGTPPLSTAGWRVELPHPFRAVARDSWCWWEAIVQILYGACYEPATILSALCILTIVILTAVLHSWYYYSYSLQVTRLRCARTRTHTHTLSPPLCVYIYMHVHTHIQLSILPFIVCVCVCVCV